MGQALIPDVFRVSYDPDGKGYELIIHEKGLYLLTKRRESGYRNVKRN